MTKRRQRAFRREQHKQAVADAHKILEEIRTKYPNATLLSDLPRELQERYQKIMDTHMTQHGYGNLLRWFSAGN